jgi:hypothetical protein
MSTTNTTFGSSASFQVTIVHQYGEESDCTGAAKTFDWQLPFFPNTGDEIEPPEMTMEKNEPPSRLDEPRWVVVHRFFTHGGVTLYVNGASLQDLFTLIKSHGWYMPDTDDQPILDDAQNELEMTRFFGYFGNEKAADAIWNDTSEGRDKRYDEFCKQAYQKFLSKQS